MNKFKEIWQDFKECMGISPLPLNNSILPSNNNVVIFKKCSLFERKTFLITKSHRKMLFDIAKMLRKFRAPDHRTEREYLTFNNLMRAILNNVEKRKDVLTPSFITNDEELTLWVEKIFR